MPRKLCSDNSELNIGLDAILLFTLFVALSTYVFAYLLFM